jgi:hypothetical protein
MGDPRVCPHGSLRRKCDLCDALEEIDALRAELAAADALLREARIPVENEDWIRYGPEKPRPPGSLIDRIDAHLAGEGE